jgi:general secretion pathway protein G
VRPPSTWHRRQRGFTLLELMIVVAILGIVASVGVPQYVSALGIARVAKAKQELVTIAQAVDSYTANNGGQLPLSLHQVGFGGRRDPWGLPYCYLNYGDGTGDGLQWAISAGLVDPAAIKSSSSGGGGEGGAGAGVAPGFSRGGFVEAALHHRAQDPVAVATAEEQAAMDAATAVASAVPRQVPTVEVQALASSLQRSGSYSVFAGVAVETTRRRDRFMFPLNTDYDLFSLGPNARTTVSLGDSLAQDDVIRANNGGFFGSASDY